MNEKNRGKCTIHGCNNPAEYKLRLYKDKETYFLVCREHFITAHPNRIFPEDKDEYNRIKEASL